MIPLKILNSKEKQEIVNILNKQFGIEQIDGMIIKIGEERLFLFDGGLNEKELRKIESIVQIERIGVYFGKFQNDMIRLSIEGVQLLQNQIKRNIFEIPEDQIENWLMGQDLLIETGKRNFLIMKYKEDLIGMGKASESKIGNYIPKSRRLKYKEPQLK